MNDPRYVKAYEAINELVAPGWEIRDRVADLSARAPEGLLAKAKLALWETCDGDPESGPWERTGTQVTWWLARDVLGRAV
jgi:hypothetical protein